MTKNIDKFRINAGEDELLFERFIKSADTNTALKVINRTLSLIRDTNYGNAATLSNAGLYAAANKTNRT